MLLFCRGVSKTEVKTTHVVNMVTAGKSGVMGQRNVKSHRSFIHQAKIVTQTCLKPRTGAVWNPNMYISNLPHANLYQRLSGDQSHKMLQTREIMSDEVKQSRHTHIHMKNIDMFCWRKVQWFCHIINPKMGLIVRCGNNFLSLSVQFLADVQLQELQRTSDCPKTKQHICTPCQCMTLSSLKL